MRHRFLFQARRLVYHLWVPLFSKVLGKFGYERLIRQPQIFENQVFYRLDRQDSFDLTKKYIHSWLIVPHLDLLFLQAANWDNIQVMEYLLDRKLVSIDAQYQGRTAIMQAAKYGRLQALELLLNRGAKMPPTIMFEIGWFSGPHDRTVKFLLEHGADPHVRLNGKGILGHLSPFLSINYLNELKQVLPVSREELNEALLYLTKTRYGFLEKIQWLVENGADLSARDPETQRTPLLNSSIHPDGEAIRFMLDHGANILDRDAKGRNILFLLGEGSLNLFKFLIDAGARIDDKLPGNIGLVSHLSAYGSHPQYLEYILDEKGLSVNELDDDGRSALVRAVSIGRSHEIIRSLLKRGADPAFGRRSFDNASAIHIAVGATNVQIPELLLEYGADVNTRDSKGNTPLIITAEYAGTKMATLLLKHGADILARNNEGKTVVDVFAEKKFYEQEKEYRDLLSHHMLLSKNRRK